MQDFLSDTVKKYQNETDEMLIERLRDGERDITDFIMNKYKNLVRSRAKTMYILGADTEDLIQEGMIGLFKAIRDYDFGRDQDFINSQNFVFPGRFIQRYRLRDGNSTCR